MSSIFFSARGTTSKVQLRSILTNFSYIKGNYQELQKNFKITEITGNSKNYRKLLQITGNSCNLSEFTGKLPVFTENYRVCIQLSVTNENCCKNWRKLAITRITSHYIIFRILVSGGVPVVVYRDFTGNLPVISGNFQ